MKKLISLLLMVCMLLSAAALAETDHVLQDETAPIAVSELNALGEMIVAHICDPQGNVIAEIKNDGTLILTDVHFREEGANEIIINRLTDAYEGVMGNVHHSDVDCRMHEHVLKPEIDSALVEGIDAYDLVMYEMFDVMLTDEALALLVDGNYLEVTFELIEEWPLPAAIIFTAEGSKWIVLEYTAEGNNRFTVRLPETGTMALLSDGRETMGIGSEIHREIAIVPGEPGDPNFTPSVSGKPAPPVVTFEMDGEVYVGWIKNTAGDVAIPVPDKNYIVVTSVAERDYVPDIQTHEHLEWGYDSILTAEDVGDLFTEHEGVILPEGEHETIAADLDNTLARLGLDLTHDELVIKDLFEVTAYGDYVEYLHDEDYYVEMTFAPTIDPSVPLVVIHSADSVHWHVNPIEEFTRNADGTVTLKMYDLGAVAFLVEGETRVEAQNAVQSPN